ncbi:MAG: M20 family metallopeptidase [Gemmatimonadaceae bacterium]
MNTALGPRPSALGSDALARAFALFTPEEHDALVTLRRDLHREPELSWKEEDTARRLEAALRALGIEDVRRVAGTGLVARVRGTEAGAPVVALRGDIDALPIHEETGFDFASQRPGVMHACGHDVHASWAVGAAALLRRSPARGDVLVVLQPAEELGEGAAAVIASGALDEARAMFGAHVDRRFEVGRVVADAGPLAASSDSLLIELQGRGGHGARPQETADPVVGAAALVMALQTVVSRRVDPARPAVVTIGAINAGSAGNVIPERAELKGTLRATDAATRERLREEVRHVAESVAAAHRLTAKVTLFGGTPPVVNPPEAAAWAQEAVRRSVGEAALAPFGITNMGAEDFSYYQEKMPACFLRVGAREPGTQPIAAHTPRFYAAEESLFLGAAVLAECARVASGALGR